MWAPLLQTNALWTGRFVKMWSVLKWELWVVNEGSSGFYQNTNYMLEIPSSSSAAWDVLGGWEFPRLCLWVAWQQAERLVKCVSSHISVASINLPAHNYRCKPTVCHALTLLTPNMPAEYMDTVRIWNQSHQKLANTHLTCKSGSKRKRTKNKNQRVCSVSSKGYKNHIDL